MQWSSSSLSAPPNPPASHSPTSHTASTNTASST